MSDTLDTLARFIPWWEVADESVSRWSVGLQIHHALLSSSRIAKAVRDAVPGQKRQTIHLVRSAILLTGKIPRGKGKAPEVALPRNDVTRDELTARLATARTRLAAAEAADPRTWFEHFAFGVMERNTALKFLHIHNRHHNAIIRDIQKA